MEPSDALCAFRRSFYECLHRRRDALFELADAILAAGGAASSPAHLSLQASHRRGWGSLYAALDCGGIDNEALRKLLARHPLDGAEGETPVLAPDDAVADVRGERRVEHLDRLEPEGLDSVEQPLAGPEQDGGHVEREFVDHSGGERLTDGRGAARDVDAILAGRLTRLRVCGLEALGDEVEARAALHLDRLAGVVGEHENRRVVGRLG